MSKICYNLPFYIKQRSGLIIADYIQGVVMTHEFEQPCLKIYIYLKFNLTKKKSYDNYQAVGNLVCRDRGPLTVAELSELWLLKRLHSLWKSNVWAGYMNPIALPMRKACSFITPHVTRSLNGEDSDQSILSSIQWSCYKQSNKWTYIFQLKVVLMGMEETRSGSSLQWDHLHCSRKRTEHRCSLQPDPTTAWQRTNTSLQVN